MAKRPWPRATRRELAHYLHVTLLDGLFRARRWAQAEIAFQGGTSLHLVHGSPRFSEDIDIILDPSRQSGPVMRAAVRHVRARLSLDFPASRFDLQLKAKEGEQGDERNPRLYEVRLTSPDYEEVIRVKAEFWVPPPGALGAYQTTIGQAGPVALNTLQARLPPVPVRVATLEAVFRDKILALAARPYLKYRDVFDLWWLRTATGLGQRPLQDLAARLSDHLALYPTGLTPAQLPAALRETAARLKDDSQRARAQTDLPQWFDPHTASLYSPAIAQMMSDAAGLLQDTADLIERPLSHDQRPAPYKGPRPR